MLAHPKTKTINCYISLIFSFLCYVDGLSVSSQGLFRRLWGLFSSSADPNTDVPWSGQLYLGSTLCKHQIGSTRLVRRKGDRHTFYNRGGEHNEGKRTFVMADVFETMLV